MARTRGISLGSSVKLIPLEEIAKQFDISEDAARFFVESLGLAIIQPPGGRRLVNLGLFLLAVWTASRIGSPNFIPDSRSDSHEEYINEVRRSLPPSEIEEGFDRLAKELAYSRTIFNNVDPLKMFSDLRESVEKIFFGRLRLGGREAQARYTNNSERHYVR